MKKKERKLPILDICNCNMSVIRTKEILLYYHRFKCISFRCTPLLNEKRAFFRLVQELSVFYSFLILLILFFFDMIKVCKEDGSLAYYIDGLSETENWMKFINCARNNEEQNLVLIQDGEQLFYESCREILYGEEMLVWYGNRYHMFMGIPTGMKASPCKERNNETAQGRMSIFRLIG